VFDDECSQHDLYQETSQHIPQQLLQGFNCSIIAYGPTGTGKTHALFAAPEHGQDGDSHSLEGLIPRICQGLFNELSTSEPEKEFTIRCSVVEIYLERIRDLLNESSHVRVASGGRLTGCAALSCLSASDVTAIVQRATEFRTASATEPNRDSSRSTCVLQLQIDQLDQRSGEVTINCLHAYDLAASELAAIECHDEHLEPAQISQSLQSLHHYVHAEVDRQARDSPSAAQPVTEGPVVTQLLSTKLGGKSHTSIILTASPSNYAVHETVKTLKFGLECRKLLNRPELYFSDRWQSCHESLLDSNERQERLEILVRALAVEYQKVRQGGGTINRQIDEVVQQVLATNVNHRPLNFSVESSKENELRSENSRLKSRERQSEQALDEAISDMGQLKSDVAILQAQIESRRALQAKQQQELTMAKQECVLLKQRNQELENHLRTSQFRENEAVVFLRQFRQFYFRLLSKTAASGSGDADAIMSRIPGAPDLTQLVDIDQLMTESGLLEANEVGRDAGYKGYRPSPAALSQSTTAAVQASETAVKLENDAVVNDSENGQAIEIPKATDSVSTKRHETGESIEARQKLYQTPGGRLISMREKVLEEELLQLSEKCIRLQNMVDEEKVNVEALTGRTGVAAAFDKMRNAQEIRGLKEQLDCRANDLQAIIWKMNENHVVIKNFHDKVTTREQHVAYLEENLTDLQNKNGILIADGQENEKKLRDDIATLQRNLKGVTVPVWHFSETTLTKPALETRLVLPFSPGEKQLGTTVERRPSLGEAEKIMQYYYMPDGKGFVDGTTQTDKIHQMSFEAKTPSIEAITHDEIKRTTTVATQTEDQITMAPISSQESGSQTKVGVLLTNPSIKASQNIVRDPLSLFMATRREVQTIRAPLSSQKSGSQTKAAVSMTISSTNASLHIVRDALFMATQTPVSMTVSSAEASQNLVMDSLFMDEDDSASFSDVEGVSSGYGGLIDAYNSNYNATHEEELSPGYWDIGSAETYNCAQPPNSTTELEPLSINEVDSTNLSHDEGLGSGHWYDGSVDAYNIAPTAAPSIPISVTDSSSKSTPSPEDQIPFEAYQNVDGPVTELPKSTDSVSTERQVTGESIEAQQELYQTLDGRLISMRERKLEEELLELSEKCVRLQNMVEEEKVSAAPPPIPITETKPLSTSVSHDEGVASSYDGLVDAYNSAPTATSSIQFFRTDSSSKSTPSPEEQIFIDAYPNVSATPPPISISEIGPPSEDHTAASVPSAQNDIRQEATDTEIEPPSEDPTASSIPSAQNDIRQEATDKAYSRTDSNGIDEESTLSHSDDPKATQTPKSISDGNEVEAKQGFTQNHSQPAGKGSGATGQKRAPLSAFMTRMRAQAERAEKKALEDDDESTTPEFMKKFRTIGKKNLGESVIEASGQVPSAVVEVTKKWTPRRKKDDDDDSDSDDTFTRDFMRGSRNGATIDEEEPSEASDNGQAPAPVVEVSKAPAPAVEVYKKWVPRKKKDEDSDSDDSFARDFMRGAQKVAVAADKEEPSEASDNEDDQPDNKGDIEAEKATTNDKISAEAVVPLTTTPTKRMVGRYDSDDDSSDDDSSDGEASEAPPRKAVVPPKMAHATESEDPPEKAAVEKTVPVSETAVLPPTKSNDSDSDDETSDEETESEDLPEKVPIEKKAAVSAPAALPPKKSNDSDDETSDEETESEDPPEKVAVEKNTPLAETAVLPPKKSNDSEDETSDEETESEDPPEKVAVEKKTPLSETAFLPPKKSNDSEDETSDEETELEDPPEKVAVEKKAVVSETAFLPPTKSNDSDDETSDEETESEDPPEKVAVEKKAPLSETAVLPPKKSNDSEDETSDEETESEDPPDKAAVGKKAVVSETAVVPPKKSYDSDDETSDEETESEDPPEKVAVEKNAVVSETAVLPPKKSNDSDDETSDEETESEDPPERVVVSETAVLPPNNSNGTDDEISEEETTESEDLPEKVAAEKKAVVSKTAVSPPKISSDYDDEKSDEETTDSEDPSEKAVVEKKAVVSETAVLPPTKSNDSDDEASDEETESEDPPEKVVVSETAVLPPKKCNDSDDEMSDEETESDDAFEKAVVSETAALPPKKSNDSDDETSDEETESVDPPEKVAVETKAFVSETAVSPPKKSDDSEDETSDEETESEDPPEKVAVEKKAFVSETAVLSPKKSNDSEDETSDEETESEDLPEKVAVEKKAFVSETAVLPPNKSNDFEDETSDEETESEDPPEKAAVEKKLPLSETAALPPKKSNETDDETSEEETTESEDLPDKGVGPTGKSIPRSNDADGDSLNEKNVASKEKHVKEAEKESSEDEEYEEEEEEEFEYEEEYAEETAPKKVVPAKKPTVDVKATLKGKETPKNEEENEDEEFEYEDEYEEEASADRPVEDTTPRKAVPAEKPTVEGKATVKGSKNSPANEEEEFEYEDEYEDEEYTDEESEASELVAAADSKTTAKAKSSAPKKVSPEVIDLTNRSEPANTKSPPVEPVSNDFGGDAFASFDAPQPADEAVIDLTGTQEESDMFQGAKSAEFEPRRNVPDFAAQVTPSVTPAVNGSDSVQAQKKNGKKERSSKKDKGEKAKFVIKNGKLVKDDTVPSTTPTTTPKKAAAAKSKFVIKNGKLVKDDSAAEEKPDRSGSKSPKRSSKPKGGNGKNDGRASRSSSKARGSGDEVSPKRGRASRSSSKARGSGDEVSPKRGSIHTHNKNSSSVTAAKERRQSLDSQSASPQKVPRGRGVVRIVSSNRIRGISAHAQDIKPQPTPPTPKTDSAASFVIKGGKLVKQDVSTPRSKKVEDATPGEKKKASAFSIVGGKLVKSDTSDKPKATKEKKKEKTESGTGVKKKRTKK
jgi:hypothetical protein